MAVFEQQSIEQTRDTIPELAAYYSDLISETAIADKNLYLIGWSMGGAIALELAQALTFKGLQVEQVILLDSLMGVLDPAQVDAAMCKALLVAELGALADQDANRSRIFERNLHAFIHYTPAQFSTYSQWKNIFCLATQNPLSNMIKPWLKNIYSGEVIEVAATHASIVRDEQIKNMIQKINDDHTDLHTTLTHGVTV